MVIDFCSTAAGADCATATVESVPKFDQQLIGLLCARSRSSSNLIASARAALIFAWRLLTGFGASRRISPVFFLYVSWNGSSEDENALLRGADARPPGMANAVIASAAKAAARNVFLLYMAHLLFVFLHREASSPLESDSKNVRGGFAAECGIRPSCYDI